MMLKHQIILKVYLFLIDNDNNNDIILPIDNDNNNVIVFKLIPKK